MTWQPGQPIVTQQDRADWLEWRRVSKRDAQRARRARYPRIDYYPDRDAAELIYNLWAPRPGCDLSSIINLIVAGWAARGEPLPPE